MTANTEARPRILLVDDEPHVTRGLRISFRRQPWDVDTAESGEEALERMAEAPYDVVVSDERMPGMQGSSLLSHVRERWPETIRIILSGQASVEAAARAINSAEIHRLLLKPCPPPEVASVITEALTRRAERLAFEAWRQTSLVQDAGPLRASFDRALDRLWVGFQPIVRARDMTLFGFEALYRSDEEEFANPAQILAAAKELGLEREVGSRVREAIARSVPRAPSRALILVNILPFELLEDDLVSVAAPLAPHAERIVLEITEREPFSGEEEMLHRLTDLRSQGYRIAVDDLGAGYSGLNTFTLFAPDFVKFDMELIRGIHRSPTKASLIRSMTQVCRELGIQSVAEGIEDDEELGSVIELGCDLLQGFHIGRPQRGFDEERREAA